MSLAIDDGLQASTPTCGAAGTAGSAEGTSNWCAASSRYRALRAVSSSWRPVATTRPWSRTTIWSASTTVANRCATTSVVRSFDAVRIARCNAALTVVRRDLGKPDDEPCHEVPAFAREIADRHLEATCLHILGTVHRRLGHHRRALDHLGEALELATALRTAPLPADTLADLARTHLDQGEYQPAQDYLQHALDLAEASGLRLTRARVLTHTAALALGEADPGRASACAEAALAICRETGYRPGEAYGESVLAQVRRLAGDLPGAERHARRAQMIVADLGMPEPVS